MYKASSTLGKRPVPSGTAHRAVFPASLARAKASKVLTGLWDLIAKELDLEAARRDTIEGNLQKDLRRTGQEELLV